MCAANIQRVMARLFQDDDALQQGTITTAFDRAGQLHSSLEGHGLNVEYASASESYASENQMPPDECMHSEQAAGIKLVRSLRSAWETGPKQFFSSPRKKRLSAPGLELGRLPLQVEVELAMQSAPRVLTFHEPYLEAASLAGKDSAGDPKKESLEGSETLPKQSDASPLHAASQPSREVEQGLLSAWVMPHFAWPELCDALLDAIPHEFSSFADEICKQTQANRKVIGFAASGEGQGGSTLLLALARRLSVERQALVVVDADFANGRLAEMLGVQPHFGWNDAIEGRATLADALVESLQDGITLLTCSRKSDDSLWDKVTPSVGMQMLRNNFSLVLVDLGVAPSNASHLPQWLNRRRWLDAAILVQDERCTEQVNEAWRQAWNEQRVPLLGVIQNFVDWETLSARAAA